MFDAVRNNKRIVQVFLALITLPFAFFGVDSYMRDSGAGSDVAAIGELKITQQQFQQTLRKLGFTVKLKPYIQRSDGSAKGDWDVGITIDVLDAVERVDEIVLASGDGDFDLLLERVRSRGVEAIAYGAPGLTAQSLIRAASLYVPIEGELLLRNH